MLFQLWDEAFCNVMLNFNRKFLILSSRESCEVTFYFVLKLFKMILRVFNHVRFENISEMALETAGASLTNA